MENMEFDKIREKLYDVQMPVEADVWGNIQGSLRRRRLRKVLYFASSSAAAILLALLMLLSGRDSIDGTTLVAQVAAPAESQAPVQPAQEIPGESTPQEIPDKPSDAYHVEAANIVEASKNTVHEEDAEALSPSVAHEAAKPEGTLLEEAGTKLEEAAPEQPEATTRDVRAISLDDDTFGMEEPVKARRRYALAFSQGIMPGSSASVDPSWIRASSAFGGALGHSHMVEQISDTKYSLPVNLGVQMQFPIGENAALGVGITYSMLKSKYDCLIDKVRYGVKQKLHYIGIPINVYGLIADRNNFIFYVNGGVSFEKGVRAVYDLKGYNSSQSYSTDIDGVQFSVNAGLGVEYKFGNTLGLYFEPSLVYYTNSEVMYSIRTDQPFQVKADIGFRFHF